MPNFKSLPAGEFATKPVQLFAKTTPLLCAGTPEDFNCMTIGWGSVGCIWGRPYVSVYVRPTRHTFAFIENNEYFSINCFGDNARDMLIVMGSKSGRDIDKKSYEGLTPLFSYEAPVFDEAGIVLVCKKMYSQMMQPELLEGEYKKKVIDGYYRIGENNNNFHKIFYGEIIHVLEGGTE
jgi:flavin reductase (DIM6/NTAB) family NADH-FMN oxidoreductase RutF